jgi:hypothetical protein
MRRIRRYGASLTVAACVAAAGGAGAAGAAVGLAYRGHTSQRQTVSFTLSGTTVRNFNVTITDRCPNGHRLRIAASYPTMHIKNGKFGGNFRPVGAHKGEKATLKATVGATKVSGQLQDTSFNKGALCNGNITFSATHH